jgi:hypothetical protein
LLVGRREKHEILKKKAKRRKRRVFFPDKLGN